MAKKQDEGTLDLAEVQKNLEIQKQFVLGFADMGGVSDPEDFPLLQELLPAVFAQAKMIRVNALLRQLQDNLQLVGDNGVAIGKISAKAKQLQAEAAALISEELGDIEPLEVSLVSSFFDPAVFDELQVAIKTGNADSITKKNFPSNQPPISYLRFRLMALEEAKNSWLAQEEQFDNADGKNAGYVLKMGELDFSEAAKFCQAQQAIINLEKNRLVIQYMIEHPKESE
jgi:hypothetical protein